jgi:protein-L-isoaspartate(D-aspartate) O-methyltransferase
MGGTEVFAERRHQMVETQLLGRGMRDQAVLTAMRTVPREAFVPAELRTYAYEDMPLPIGHRQTISQPSMVAWMLEALQLAPDDRVLEIGTGSGYAAAVLSYLAQTVYTVERLETWVRHAGQCLQRLGYHNVYLRYADGTLGWPEHAPYHGIVVSAGGPTIPAALQDQLALGGRLVIPVGAHQRRQQLLRVTREGATTWRQEALGAVRFVPLIGAQGWPARPPRQRGQHASAPPRAPAKARREASDNATQGATSECMCQKQSLVRLGFK